MTGQLLSELGRYLTSLGIRNTLNDELFFSETFKTVTCHSLVGDTVSFVKEL